MPFISCIKKVYGSCCLILPFHENILLVHYAVIRKQCDGCAEALDDAVVFFFIASECRWQAEFPPDTDITTFGQDNTAFPIDNGKTVSDIYLFHTFELTLIKWGIFIPEIFLFKDFCPNLCCISANKRYPPAINTTATPRPINVFEAVPMIMLVIRIQTIPIPAIPRKLPLIPNKVNGRSRFL